LPLLKFQPSHINLTQHNTQVTDSLGPCEIRSQGFSVYPYS